MPSYVHPRPTASVSVLPGGHAAARPRSRGNAHAFTLMEVMIAMFIAMIMTGVVMYLFNQTQRGTRVSLARAQLMLTASTVDSRLRMDAATMVGPDRTNTAAGSANPAAGGCLLIIPALREGYVPLPNGQMSRNKVRLRSDQLVFISKRDPNMPHPWVSMLPLQQNQAPNSASISSSSSWEARIWYGAVKDGNLAGGDGTSNDPAMQAHLWMVGRQAKLLVQDQKAGALNCTVTPNDDTTAGSLVKPTAATTWQGLKDTALSGSWTDDDYVANLIGNGASGTVMTAAEQLDHANPPVTTPTIDLKQLQQGNTASGVQLADLAASHLRLFENCSEIVVQWAGDLDKDGNIDTYPAGHPLAGAIIWYPEELHTNVQKDATTKTHLSGALLTKYNAIGTNPWTNTFPSGFAPCLAAWPNGRFGANTHPAVAPAPVWAGRFQFDYGETDNKPNQTNHATVNVPKPYVFRFNDDQYRLVRYGYRQDGSNYKNMWDSKTLPTGNKHYFPYPPTAGVGMSDGFPTYYNGKAAPTGPYPCAATGAGANGTNFGDLTGGSCWPMDAVSGALSAAWNAGTSYTAGTKVSLNNINYTSTGATPNLNQNPAGNPTYWTQDSSQPWKYRTAGNSLVGDPGRYGYLVAVANPAVPTAPGNNVFALPAGAMTLSLGAPSAAGTEPQWPYYSGGNLVAIRQVDGGAIATLARPACDTTADTASLPSTANPIGPMAQQFGPDNNFTVTYTDIWAEYLKTINDPAKAADSNAMSREDWRMPQSDWPRLIRLRVRLHDNQGLVASYSDEFLINGRDNDGDGVVNNPEEARMSGIWFEYIFAVPYPTDPSPRQH